VRRAARAARRTLGATDTSQDSNVKQKATPGSSPAWPSGWQAALRRPFRQVLKLDIVGSAFAIAVFLIMYYLAVGFLPAFFQTVFGFSQSTASSLGNWFWAGQAVALVVTGVVSDRLRVRKPFMLIGAIGAVITTTVFALRATQHATRYQTFAVLLTLLAVCIGITYAPWMASFTETVERRNPALTATGLAMNRWWRPAPVSWPRACDPVAIRCIRGYPSPAPGPGCWR